MFIKVTSSETGNTVRANPKLIICYFKNQKSTRLIYVNGASVEVLESPEQIDELIKKSMDRDIN